MKRIWSKLAIALLGLAATGASAAWAQEETPSLAPRDPAEVLAQADADESTPDVITREVEGSLGYWEQEPRLPWTLPQPRILQNFGIKVGGWLQQGINTNTTNPTDGFNGPIATNDMAGQYQLNQLWFFFDRPTNTEGRGFDIGGHVDVAYGTDWRFGRCYGLENNFDSANQYYGLILPQFYAEIAYSDLKVKLGKYAPMVGYENVPGPMNFFYSHSYALAYSNPLLLTGMWADYAYTDDFHLLGGFHRGDMMFDEWPNNSTYNVIGGFRWGHQTDPNSLSFIMNSGPSNPAGLDYLFQYTLVYQYIMNEQWKFALENDLGTLTGGNPRGGNAAWWDFCGYAFYTLNEQWSIGSRLEQFRDPEGARVAGVGNWIGSNKGWLGLPGFAGDFYETTLGFNYRPNKNFVLRPEARYDWYTGTTNVANQEPFGGGNATAQWLFSVDLIMTF